MGLSGLLRFQALSDGVRRPGHFCGENKQQEGIGNASAARMKQTTRRNTRSVSNNSDNFRGKAGFWQAKSPFLTVSRAVKADATVPNKPARRANIPSGEKLKRGGRGLPFGKRVLGLRRSSKNGSAQQPMAVSRLLGSYVSVRPIRLSALSGVPEWKT